MSDLEKNVSKETTDDFDRAIRIALNIVEAEKTKAQEKMDYYMGDFLDMARESEENNEMADSVGFSIKQWNKYKKVSLVLDDILGSLNSLITK